MKLKVVQEEVAEQSAGRIEGNTFKPVGRTAFNLAPYPPPPQENPPISARPGPQL